MPRPVHFEIDAENPDRVAGFYSDVFGWTFNHWDGGGTDYWMIMTGDDEPGINGGMSRRNGQANGTINSIGVSSVDECVQKVEGSGGAILQPKMAIPGAGYFALCADPDGNRFGLFEDNPAAA